MRWIVALICLSTIPSSAQLIKVFDLPQVPEASGNIWINNKLWMLNDGGNAAVLLQIDTSTGKVVDSTTFANADNQDWEELCTNGTEVFIGDFGNNQGTRKDLRIYRFPISELGNKLVKCDTIAFHYPSQTSFAPTSLTKYDCEGMIAFPDSILLFSKSIIDAVCRVYSIPNKKGSFAAKLIDSLALDFWVTGSAINGNNLILCGYGFNGQLTPQYAKGHFSGGRVFPFGFQSSHLTTGGSGQIEGVLIHNNKVYFSAEGSNGYSAALYVMNFTPLMTKAPDPESGLLIKSSSSQKVTEFEFDDRWVGGRLTISNAAGAEVWSARIISNRMAVLSSELGTGTYVYQVRLKRKRISGKFFVE